jgi:hypothetical protein
MLHVVQVVVCTNSSFILMQYVHDTFLKKYHKQAIIKTNMESQTDYSNKYKYCITYMVKYFFQLIF